MTLRVGTGKGDYKLRTNCIYLGKCWNRIRVTRAIHYIFEIASFESWIVRGQLSTVSPSTDIRMVTDRWLKVFKSTHKTWSLRSRKHNNVIIIAIVVTAREQITKVKRTKCKTCPSAKAPAHTTASNPNGPEIKKFKMFGRTLLNVTTHPYEFFFF